MFMTLDSGATFFCHVLFRITGITPSFYLFILSIYDVMVVGEPDGRIFIYLSIYLSLYISIYLYIYLSINLSIYNSIYLGRDGGG